ncbi:TolC family protein, partial [Pelomonas sp. KK5]|uniref:TolC family protein n=1 Tax=Pelomonas sp. KK5 TaxID=1855730 RepID=UPI001E293353
MKSRPVYFARRLLAVAASLMVAACASLPEAAPQPEPLGPKLAHVAPASTQQAAPALDDWWQGFHDPVLSELVSRALAQNLDLAAALARVEQARAAAQGAGAATLPQIGLQGSLLAQRQSLKSPEGALASGFPGYQREQTLQTLGIGASWEADLGRGLDQGRAAAQADWRVAQAQRSGVQGSVVAEVADAYFR